MLLNVTYSAFKSKNILHSRRFKKCQVSVFRSRKTFLLNIVFPLLSKLEVKRVRIGFRSSILLIKSKASAQILMSAFEYQEIFTVELRTTPKFDSTSLWHSNEVLMFILFLEKSPPWSEEECKNFEHALQMYDKNFHLIQKHKVSLSVEIGRIS